MSNLNLDIKEIRRSIQNTNDMLSNFSGITGEFFSRLSGVDTVWNDDDTPAFIKTVINDKERFNELISSIKKQVSVSQNFCDNLQAALDNYFDISTLYSIRYTGASTDRSIELLTEIEQRINSIRDNISTLSIPASSSNRSVIQGIASDIDTRQIAITKKKIADAIIAINKIVDDARDTASSTKRYEMDSSTISYSSRIHTPEIKRTQEVNEKQVMARKVTEKANLANKGLTVDTGVVMFTNKAKQGDLKDAPANIGTDEDSFNERKKQAVLNNNNNYQFNTNYGFYDKNMQADLNNQDEQDIKEFGYQNKVKSIDLSANKDVNINNNYSYNNKTAMADFNDINPNINDGLEINKNQINDLSEISGLDTSLTDQE